LRIVSAKEAVAVGAASVTTEIVTVFGEGMLDGGVYRPVVEIDPVAEAPPVTPLTCQSTEVSVVPVTVAVN